VSDTPVKKEKVKLSRHIERKGKNKQTNEKRESPIRSSSGGQLGVQGVVWMKV